MVATFSKLTTWKKDTHSRDFTLFQSYKNRISLLLSIKIKRRIVEIQHRYGEMFEVLEIHWQQSMTAKQKHYFSSLK